MNDIISNLYFAEITVFYQMIQSHRPKSQTWSRKIRRGVTSVAASWSWHRELLGDVDAVMYILKFNSFCIRLKKKYWFSGSDFSKFSLVQAGGFLLLFLACSD